MTTFRTLRDRAYQDALAALSRYFDIIEEEIGGLILENQERGDRNADAEDQRIVGLEDEQEAVEKAMRAVEDIPRT